MIYRTELNNGIRVVLEPVKNVRSISLGIWITVGSRNEKLEESGAAHFIEHILFKGTERRSSKTISSEINRLGNEVNAWTSQEMICLYGKTIDENTNELIDLLTDLFFHSKFSPVEIGREKKVVIEEINMYNDSPEDLIFDIFIETMWQNSPLGNPVLGKINTVENFNRRIVRDFYKREFSFDKIVISAAGNFKPDEIIAQLNKSINNAAIKKTHIKSESMQYNPNYAISSKFAGNLDQVHFCMGTDAINRTSEDRFAFSLLNTILSAGSGSRIFDEIREKRGWAYSIGSSVILFNECGLFAISGGIQKKHLVNSFEIILKEIRKIATRVVSDTELEIAKKELKSSILLGLENTRVRMTRNAEQLIFLGKLAPVKQVLKMVEDVTKKDILVAAERYLKNKKFTIASIGPLKQKDLAQYESATI